MKHKLIAGVICALACWLGFPNQLIQLPLLAFVFPLVTPVIAIQAASARKAFCFGFFSGTAGYAACLYWVAVPVHDFGYMPWVVALPFPLLLGAYLGAYSGLFCLILYSYARKFCATDSGRFSFSKLRTFDLFRLTLLSALAWALLEYLRGWLFTGFPWLTLSSAFVPWTWAIQGLSALGAYTLSGVYAGLAASLGLSGIFLHQREGKSSLFPIFPPLLFSFLAVALLSAWTIHTFTPSSEASRAVGVLLVQGNVNQDQKWDPAYQKATFARYSKLTEAELDNLAKNARGFDQHSAPDTPPYDPPLKLVVWPETAMPFFYSRGGDLSLSLNKLAHRRGIYLLFGAPDIEQLPEKTAVYNRAYLLAPTSRIMGFYDKEHLVPFGEYAPSWLRIPLLEFLLAQVGDLDPGIQVAPLHISHPTGDVSIGMLICYEVIFPELARKRVADGGNILLTISNDAWFGNTAAPEQHLQLAAMRAVEQGKWLVRATNTGISAIVNQHGKKIAQGRLFVPETLSGLAYTRGQTTLFYRLEPYLLYLLIFILALLLLSGYIGKHRNLNRIQGKYVSDT